MPQKTNGTEAANNAPNVGVGGGPGTPPKFPSGGKGKKRKMAGENFGLMPTEVVESTRGRGYGLTYQPQQRGSKTTKFGGGGPLINFNPILSQQANPNISVMSAGGDITTGAGKGVGGKVGGGKVGGGEVGRLGAEEGAREVAVRTASRGFAALIPGL